MLYSKNNKTIDVNWPCSSLKFTLKLNLTCFNYRETITYNKANKQYLGSTRNNFKQRCRKLEHKNLYNHPFILRIVLKNFN